MVYLFHSGSQWIESSGFRPWASSLAKRFGNVRTMVFTHLPSAIFLALNRVHFPHPWLLLELSLNPSSWT
ncbi:hypothetical protein HRG_014279 [Hirsutella rhossiliensis]